MFHDEQLPDVKRPRPHSPARPIIPLRDWTSAQRTLHGYRVSLSRIAARAALTEATVCRALSLKHFEGVAFGSVARMRAAAEALLRDAGYAGEPGALWADYDAVIRRDPYDKPPPQAA